MKSIKIPDEKPYKIAIYVWRSKILRHGMTLPMLAAFSVWYKGGNFEDIPTVKAEAEIISKEMYSHPECCFPVIVYTGKNDRLGFHYNATEGTITTRLNSFQCGMIHELVFGLREIDGHRTTPATAMSRYDWSGVSKNNGKWGPLSAWDLEFFKCVARFIEKGVL